MIKASGENWLCRHNWSIGISIKWAYIVAPAWRWCGTCFVCGGSTVIIKLFKLFNFHLSFRYVPQWPVYCQQQHCAPAEYWWGWYGCSALHNQQDCLLYTYTWSCWGVVLPWWKDGSHYGSCSPCYCWAVLSKQRHFIDSSEQKVQPGFVRHVLWSVLLPNTRPKQCDSDIVCGSISHWKWRWVFFSFLFLDAAHITSPHSLV